MSEITKEITKLVEFNENETSVVIELRLKLNAGQLYAHDEVNGWTLLNVSTLEKTNVLEVN